MAIESINREAIDTSLLVSYKTQHLFLCYVSVRPSPCAGIIVMLILRLLPLDVSALCSLEQQLWTQQQLRWCRTIALQT